MKRNNKTCICCSTKYTFCPNCAEFDHLPRWMGIYCSENCKKVMDIASDYEYGVLTKEEAKEKFDVCDLSNKNNFHHSIRKVLDEIYAIDTSKITASAKVRKTKETSPVTE